MPFISYLITDPKYFSNTPSTFRTTLLKSFDFYRPNFVCFRDKISSNKYELATIFVQTCKEQNIEKILINSDIELAYKLQADGVHLTSSQFEEIQYAKSKDLFVMISCHSITDIKNAKLSGADGATYSPIFHSPNKAKPIGIDAITKAKEEIKDILIIGLGGIISKNQIDAIAESGADGFASIRFWLGEN